MTSPYSNEQVLEAYQGHPLSFKTIRDRIASALELGMKPTELDIAVDSAGGVTDQNHIGGALSTIHLGIRVGLTASDRVLDLGCGIGGPARMLAEVFGCAVRGLDLNQQRIDDAERLTALVGLTELVHFECGDILQRSYYPEFTVVWAQNSWIHIDRPARLSEAAASALVEGGRIAFEDVCLRREPATREEQDRLDVLFDAWRSSLSNVEVWSDGLRAAGFRVLTTDDLTATLAATLDQSKVFVRRYPGRFPQREVDGWVAAKELTESGVIGYCRMVGVLTGASRNPVAGTPPR